MAEPVRRGPMGRGPMGHGPGAVEKPKDLTGTLRQPSERTWADTAWPSVAVLVFAALSTIFNIAGPKILAKATTALATGWYAMITGTGSIDFGYIGKILLILLGMYLLSRRVQLCPGLADDRHVPAGFATDFRRQISEKIDRLPLALL